MPPSSFSLSPPTGGPFFLRRMERPSPVCSHTDAGQEPRRGRGGAFLIERIQYIPGDVKNGSMCQRESSPTFIVSIHFFRLYINEINEKQLWEGSHIVLF